MADLADSILAALDAKSDDAYWIYRGTLEALLDLHREDAGRCYRCVLDCRVEYGGPIAEFEPYPCPTVRAVAERLGVEAGG